MESKLDQNLAQTHTQKTSKDNGIFFMRIFVNFIFSRTPNVTEEQAREALAQYVSENCCFGSTAAKEMVFTDITHSSAFHVSLSVLAVFLF